MIFYSNLVSKILIFSFGGYQILLSGILIICVLILGELKDNWKQFLPIIYFFLPYILLSQFLLNTSFIMLLINVLILHVLITLPIIISLKKLNDWQNEKLIYVTERENLYDFLSFNFYYDLAIGLLYPYIFGILILTFRYTCMGRTINMEFLFDKLFFNVVFVLLCYLPLIIWLLIKISIFYQYLYKILWSKFSNILYSFHLFFLNYWYDYFYIFFKLHKFGFFIRAWVSKSSKTDWPDNPSLFWRIVDDFYSFPQYWVYIIGFLGIFEILIFKQLFYIFYLLFIFIFFRSILSNLFYFSFTPFGYDCCYANYLYKNYFLPRFPLAFYDYLKSAYDWNGFLYNYSPTEKKFLNKRKQMYFKKLQLMEKIRSFSFLIRLGKLSNKRYSFSKVSRICIIFLMLFGFKNKLII